MNIYSHRRYQSALFEVIESKKKLPEKWTLRKLAQKCGLQASFLTNVLKGRFDFNADQLYVIADHLVLTAEEKTYLLLLLEHQRSAHPGRKKELLSKIEKMREKHLATEKHLLAKVVETPLEKITEYYLDPFVQLVHVHLNFPHYQTQPQRLCKDLGISSKHLSKILSLLIRLSYVQNSDGRYKVIAKNKHLPKESPLCGPHQALIKLKSIDQMQRLDPEEIYSFAVTFTGTDETKAKIREEFLQFLKRVESVVKAADSQNVYQMNFDLFPWALMQDS